MYAVALAVATFIENSYGNEAARAVVYDSWWLEVILLILGANLVANIFRYKLYKKQKITLGIFHASFILILIGAGITRYIGYEGVMHIREGESSSIMVADKPSFHFVAELEGEKKEVEARFLLSSTSKDQINEKLKIGGRTIKIKSVDYLSNAQKGIEPDKNGDPFVEIVYPVGGAMKTELLKKGGMVNINGIRMGFGIGTEVQFSHTGDTLRMMATDSISTISMGGSGGMIYSPGEQVKIVEKTVYKVKNAAFIIKQFLPSAKLTAVTGSAGDGGEGAVKIQISDNQATEVATIWIDTENKGPRYESVFEGIKISSRIGSKEINLPFSIALNEFVLERYPGSNSPSSFESLVTLVDKEQGIDRDHRIFMNNVLKHRGYRFYQSSYDTDEKGTILSVNNDPWGTLITYIGYALLCLGILLSIFNPQSYFARLMKKATSAAVLLVLLTFTGSMKAEAALPQKVNDDIASEFSSVWVQGHEGRIKPFSTLAYEVIMKVTRLEKYLGQSPEQVVLGMTINPHEYQTIPMIAINDIQIEKMLGLSGDKAAFSDFFDQTGNYKFAREIQTAYSKNPAQRNKFDNALIKIDERLNVAYQLYNGELFRFFPSPDNKDVHWYTPNGSLPASFSADSSFVRKSFRSFLEAVKTNNTAEAKSLTSSIKDYQQKYGTVLIPGKTKGNLEIIYNRVNVFHDLSLWYLLLGFILVIFFFHSIFTGRSLRKKAVKYTLVGLLIGFIAHCLGLIVRGYISGHMPWSNGYESMIYIAWAGMLAGLIFAKHNPMVLGAAAILSGLTLFVAQMSWLNPEITNLVPVLKSYWLTIHVAIITASYGFFGVSAIIGLLNLLLATFQNERNRKRLSANIIQMTAVNQASLILGLYFLTMGTFLGGIWANESWGRYWGWDPKETWSLVTIIGYTFITHMRWIPGFRGWFALNIGSVTGMLLVLMTYLGVNYYLSGLHSYGSGSGLQFPVVLVIVFVVFGIIAFIAKRRGDIIEKADLSE